jgi:hypothetical protein
MTLWGRSRRAVIAREFLDLVTELNGADEIKVFCILWI